MIFRSLELTDWRQYERVSIDFHSNITILTGANGSGKTTILNILGQHYNWVVNFVGTPRRDRQTGTLQYLVDVFRRRSQLTSLPSYVDIGRLIYEDGSVGQIQAPVQAGQQYGVNIAGRQHISGLYIPSHRPIYSYQPVSSIPTQALNRQQVYQEYFNSTFYRYMGQNYAKAPNQLMKEALISLATFGPGNEYVAPNVDAQAIFEGFQKVLGKVLPPKIGFKRLSIQVPEVVFETASGNFSLDAVSGGLASIIDMAWRIFMYSPQGEQFVCTIDEPENHLHPELQQSLLPNLIKTFPKVQFIVATHNPFMISAVYESSVYVLDYNRDHRVESKPLDVVNKAGTANEILRDVLGLPFTMPLWAEEKLQAILQKYADKGVSDETVDELEAELVEAGLESLVPDTIPELSSEREDQ